MLVVMDLLYRPESDAGCPGGTKSARGNWRGRTRRRFRDDRLARRPESPTQSAKQTVKLSFGLKPVIRNTTRRYQEQTE